MQPLFRISKTDLMVVVGRCEGEKPLSFHCQGGDILLQ